MWMSQRTELIKAPPSTNCVIQRDDDENEGKTNETRDIHKYMQGYVQSAAFPQNIIVYVPAIFAATCSLMPHI